MDQLNFFAEYAVFATMLGVSILIGLYYGCVERKQNTINEYLLGGKHMAVFPITMSLIASHISGISLLGVPAEIYSHGTQYVIVSFINVIVIFTVIYIYLPVFYELQLTSVYEYLELRFNSNIRGFSSLLFAVYLLMYIPVVIYIPALALNQVTDVNIHLITPIMCTVCIFYTTVGGLKAVVWTDAIQSVFTTLALAVIIILGLNQVGGLGEMINANQEGDRIELFRMDPNPFLRHTFWTLSIGTVFSWVAQLGIHPGSIQRFVALPTYNKACKALMYFVFGVGVVQFFCSAVGMLIYTKYKNCDPVSTGYIKSDKSLVTYYVMDVASKFPGLTGIFISGIASASLSTMSAQLNTVSGTIYEDFIVKMMRIKVSELTASIIMKCIVVISGFVCVGLVFVVDKLGGILQMAGSLTGMTTGPMLAVFTLGICFPCANTKGAFCGMFASLGAMAWIVAGAQFSIYNNELKFAHKAFSVTGCPANVTLRNHTDFTGLHRINEDVYASPDVWSIFTVSYQHYSTIGFLIGIVVGLAVSVLFPTDQKVDPRLLTPCVRNLVYPKYTPKNKSIVTKTDEYTAVSQDTKL